MVVLSRYRGLLEMTPTCEWLISFGPWERLHFTAIFPGSLVPAILLSLGGGWGTEGAAFARDSGLFCFGATLLVRKLDTHCLVDLFIAKRWNRRCFWRDWFSKLFHSMITQLKLSCLSGMSSILIISRTGTTQSLPASLFGFFFFFFSTRPPNQFA